MKAIMVMYDSLNRRLMPNYGCDLLNMPNFKRLGERAVTFDNCYVGSMPCMPARREIQTGRYNFLHRSWGPMEPFDDSMPQILDRNGIHTHLATDHYHYFEDGGATYHNRYTTWAGYRGQEGDAWIGDMSPLEVTQVMGIEKLPEGFRQHREKKGRQDLVNRSFIKDEEDWPQTKTFDDGLEFIRRNCKYDNWFVQIETFDPHEPFYSPDKYQDMYSENGKNFPCDWPPYGPVSSDDNIEAMRNKYYALTTMCDENLGRVLDLMDEKDLWKDTMLIVNTDHGFLLGEHGWWAKSLMPLYNEIANTPFFIWDPRCSCKNVRRTSLVQTIDIAPTLLDFFGVDIPKDMQGKALRQTIADDTPVRRYALYGYHASAINITDGEYTYMRAPVHPGVCNVYEYTLMPTHMSQMFSTKELGMSELAEAFPFTKGCPVLKIPVSASHAGVKSFEYGNLLFNVLEDPKQLHALDDPQKELELLNAMRKLMLESEAPSEQFERVGLSKETDMDMEELMKQREQRIMLLEGMKGDK